MQSFSKCVDLLEATHCSDNLTREHTTLAKAAMAQELDLKQVGRRKHFVILVPRAAEKELISEENAFSFLDKGTYSTDYKACVVSISVQAFQYKIRANFRVLRMERNCIFKFSAV